MKTINYLSAEEAAEKLGVTAHTTSDWARKGGIRGAIQPVPRGVWCLPEEAVDNLVTHLGPLMGNGMRRFRISTVLAASSGQPVKVKHTPKHPTHAVHIVLHGSWDEVADQLIKLANRLSDQKTF